MGENLGELSDTVWWQMLFKLPIKRVPQGSMQAPFNIFYSAQYFNLEEETGCSLIKPGDNSKLEGTQGPIRRT